MTEVVAPAPGDEARLRAEVQRLRRELDALHETAAELADDDGLDGALGAIVTRAAALVDGTEGFLCLAGEDGRLLPRVATGVLHEQIAGLAVGPGEGLVGRVLADGSARAVNDYASWPGRLTERLPFVLHAVAAAPMRSGDAVVGVVGLCHLGAGGAFSEADLALLDRFAGLAAIALERLRLHADLSAELDERRRTEDELVDAVARLTGSEHALRLSHEEMVRRLAAAAEFRDVQTGRHVERVGGTCELIARRLGLDEAFCESIRVASPLHDIGKIGIPDHVLLKPGPLTVEEREQIEAHAEIGHRILAGTGSELLDLAASIALTHHERFDGSGYPRGLAAAEIPVEGRIAAVADVFDALTSDRVYRSAYPVDVALELMRDGRGTQFDPDVLDAFLGNEAEAAAQPAAGAAALDAAPPTIPAQRIEPGGAVDAALLEPAVAAALQELERPIEPRQAIEAALRAFCGTAGHGVIASVYVLDHDRLWCLAQHGYDQVRDGFVLGQGVMGRCMRDEETQIVADVHADPSFIPAVPGILSEVATPLLGESVRAVLNVETIGTRLAPDAAGAIAGLAGPLAGEVDRLEGRVRLELTTMARLCVHASSLRGVGPLAEFATRTLGRLFDLEAVQLDLGGTPSGPPASFWRRPDSPLVPIEPSRIARTGATGLNDVAVSFVDGVESGLVPAGGPATWILWLPLRAGGTTVGTLVGRAREHRDLEHEQAEAATLLAQHTAALIDVAQALRREQRAAVTDGLTGLLNRRGFDQRLREEIARAERAGSTLAVVLSDCDDLKRINDRHGHERGDVVLRAMARLMRESKRRSDVAGRLGGDEFGIVLPDAGLDEATTLAERLREKLRELMPAGSHATASFGIATYPADGTTSGALMRAADRALYAAKDGGKDRVTTVG